MRARTRRPPVWSRHFALWSALSALGFGACTWAAYNPPGDAAPVRLTLSPPRSEPEAQLSEPRAPTSPQPAVEAQPAIKRQALVIGSSSIKSTFGKLIAADLERWGFEVSRHGIVAAGLARPDLFDLHQIVDELPIDSQTAAVVLYVGVNDGQALWLYPDEEEEFGAHRINWRDPRWDELYTRRAVTLFRSICERGAERAIVLLPIEIDKPSLERKMVRIRRLQEEAARQTSCATAVSTEVDNGRFSRNGKALRRRDGVHMSIEGARVLWGRVWEKVKPLLPASNAPAQRRLARERHGVAE